MAYRADASFAAVFFDSYLPHALSYTDEFIPLLLTQQLITDTSLVE